MCVATDNISEAMQSHKRALLPSGMWGHYATSRKVAGSISDEVIGFFNWPTPSSRTMALGLTEPLTEMSTRNLPGVKGGRQVRQTTSQLSVSLHILLEGELYLLTSGV
jgi:hypothetical protein